MTFKLITFNKVRDFCAKIFQKQICTACNESTHKGSVTKTLNKELEKISIKHRLVSLNPKNSNEVILSQGKELAPIGVITKSKEPSSSQISVQLLNQNETVFIICAENLEANQFVFATKDGKISSLKNKKVNNETNNENKIEKNEKNEKNEELDTDEVFVVGITIASGKKDTPVEILPCVPFIFVK